MFVWCRVCLCACVACVCDVLRASFFSGGPQPSIPCDEKTRGGVTLGSGGPAAAYRCWCPKQAKRRVESKVGRARRCRRAATQCEGFGRVGRTRRGDVRAGQYMQRARPHSGTVNICTGLAGLSAPSAAITSWKARELFVDFRAAQDGLLLHAAGVPGQPGLDGLPVKTNAGPLPRMTSPLVMMTKWRRLSPSGVPAGSGQPQDLHRHGSLCM